MRLNITAGIKYKIMQRWMKSFNLYLASIKLQISYPN